MQHPRAPAKERSWLVRANSLIRVQTILYSYLEYSTIRVLHSITYNLRVPTAQVIVQIISDNSSSSCLPPEVTSLTLKYSNNTYNSNTVYRGKSVIYCYDLSAATDRWPLQVISQVVQVLFGRGVAAAAIEIRK